MVFTFVPYLYFAKTLNSEKLKISLEMFLFKLTLQTSWVLLYILLIVRFVKNRRFLLNKKN